MTHVRTLLSHSSKIFIAVLAAALVFSWTTQPAIGHHQPANKFAAAGAALDDIDEGATKVVLSETMKVPTTHDLALSATMECSIITYLNSQGSDDAGHQDTDNAEGRVTVWITIDGTPVPVQTSGYESDLEDPDAAAEASHPTWDGADNGRVTFCNREYERYIGDREQDEDNEDGEAAGGDGVDEERDFIATRNANAFNWFALNVGRDYDKPEYNGVAGNNIILVELHVAYERENPRECFATTGGLPVPGQPDETGPPQDTCSDAWVGKRTLVAEPTNASVHEQVEPADDPASPGDQEPPPAPCDDPTGLTCGRARD